MRRGMSNPVSLSLRLGSEGTGGAWGLVCAGGQGGKGGARGARRWWWWCGVGACPREGKERMGHKGGMDWAPLPQEDLQWGRTRSTSADVHAGPSRGEVAHCAPPLMCARQSDVRWWCWCISSSRGSITCHSSVATRRHAMGTDTQHVD